MRFVESRPSTDEPLRVTEQQKTDLSAWLMIQISDAISSALPMQRLWRDNLRQYEGVPKNPVKTVPIVNMPNIEVTIGAIACDSLYANAAELIWSTSPLITIRPVLNDEEASKSASALQDFANHMATSELDLRIAYDNASLDDVQLGTGILYTPWVQWVRKTNVHVIKSAGPKTLCIPIEDFIIPVFSYSDLQQLRWIGVRFWPTMAELAEWQEMNPSWDFSHVTSAAAVDWVRQHRENLGHGYQGIQRQGDIYEIFHIYCYYDIDGDGIPEDLFIVWDRSSQTVINIQYNPYDRRPFEAMRFQQRAHLFYGIGIMEMLKAYQEEASELHNQRTLGAIIANTRLWKARTGSVPDNIRIWPGRVIQLDDIAALQPEQMGDVYPSSAQAEAITISLAERRVGLNDMSTRPSQMLGNRTPGITALSLLQQSSKRFTHSFENIRAATAGSVRQGLFRYQEQLLAQTPGVEDHIYQTMGAERGKRVVELLRRPDFQDQVVVEMTASSVSINREADRQNAMLLVNILAQYYEKTLQLISIAAQPMTPPAVKEVAGRIAEAVGNVIERTIRTFDSIRDPQTFVVEVEDIVDNLQGLDQQGLSGLGQLLTMFSQQGGGMPGGQGGEMPQMPSGTEQQ